MKVIESYIITFDFINGILYLTQDNRWIIDHPNKGEMVEITYEEAQTIIQ